MSPCSLGSARPVSWVWQKVTEVMSSESATPALHALCLRCSSAPQQLWGPGCPCAAGMLLAAVGMHPSRASQRKLKIGKTL